MTGNGLACPRQGEFSVELIAEKALILQYSNDGVKGHCSNRNAYHLLATCYVR